MKNFPCAIVMGSTAINLATMCIAKVSKLRFFPKETEEKATAWRAYESAKVYKQYRASLFFQTPLLRTSRRMQNRSSTRSVLHNTYTQSRLRVYKPTFIYEDPAVSDNITTSIARVIMYTITADECSSVCILVFVLRVAISLLDEFISRYNALLSSFFFFF